MRVGNLCTTISHSVRPCASTYAATPAAAAATAAVAAEERKYIWPCLLVEMSAVAGIELWLDGNILRGRLPPPQQLGGAQLSAVSVQTAVENMVAKLSMLPNRNNVEAARKEDLSPPADADVASTLERSCPPQLERSRTSIAPPHLVTRAAETSATTAPVAAAPMVEEPAMAAPPVVSVVHVHHHHHHVLMDHHHHHLGLPPRSRQSVLDQPS